MVNTDAQPTSTPASADAVKGKSKGKKGKGKFKGKGKGKFPFKGKFGEKGKDGKTNSTEATTPSYNAEGSASQGANPNDRHDQSILLVKAKHGTGMTGTVNGFHKVILSRPYSHGLTHSVLTQLIVILP